MQNFWKGKRVLVTGATGFIGSHITIRLVEAGADVFTLQSLSAHSSPLLLSRPDIVSRLKASTKGDISNTSFINKFFEKKSFQYCFHLAAQSLVDVASLDPTPTFNVNIKGTWNILEATRQNKLDGLIIASTSHVYGKNKLPFLEKYFPKPSRPYETSKACADILAQTYATYFSLPVAIARCVNIYGPGDQNSRIVPKTIQLLLKNQKPEIFIDQTTRDYMYVEDAVNAYIQLAEKIKLLKKKTDNIIFNFGTSKLYSNSSIVRKIISLSNKTKLHPTIIKKSRKQEISKQYVSINKAKKMLKWRPKYSLTQGLSKTIEWYQSNLINNI